MRRRQNAKGVLAKPRRENGQGKYLLLCLSLLSLTIVLFGFNQKPHSSEGEYKTNEIGESASFNHQANIATLTSNDMPIMPSLSKTS